MRARALSHGPFRGFWAFRQSSPALCNSLRLLHFPGSVVSQNPAMFYFEVQTFCSQLLLTRSRGINDLAAPKVQLHLLIAPSILKPLKPPVAPAAPPAPVRSRRPLALPRDLPERLLRS